MNRIESKFKELKQQNKKTFIAFITAGDPSLKISAALAVEIEAQGADILELGVPFSDPLADGPTIQAASERALKQKVNLPKVLELVRKVRKIIKIPIILLTYYNPIYQYGLGKFSRDAARAGVDGIIVPDLPPEEGKELSRLARKEGLDVIYLLSPTSSPKRKKLIARCSRGFIYYVSLLGVTGVRKQLTSSAKPALKEMRSFTHKPLVVGFGISSPEQVREVASFADGVIVGSAIVKQIEANIGRRDLVQRVGKFVGKLSRAAKK